MIDRRSYTHNLAVGKLKPEKTTTTCQNGIRTHDLRYTGAVLYQLSYQGNWELVTLWVRNIPVDGILNNNTKVSRNNATVSKYIVSRYSCNFKSFPQRINSCS